MHKEIGIIREFLGFIIKPDYHIKNEDINRQQTVFKLIKLFLFCSVVCIIIAVIIHLTESESSSLKETIEKQPFIRKFLSMVIITPLIEEIMFRLPIRFSKWNITISFLVLSYGFMTVVIFDTRYFDVGNHFITRIGVAVLVSIIVFYLSKLYQEKLQKFWEKYFRFMLYFFCFFFAFLHITNYDDITTRILLLTPLLTLSQLVGAFSYSFVRMKYGFGVGVLLHSMKNFIVLLPHILSAVFYNLATVLREYNL